MRLVIQRVNEAKVTVDGKTVGEIGKGALVLFGAHKDDQKQECAWLADKLVNLRFFMDQEEKMNLSLKDTEGSVLIVSQFTLYGNCLEGRRPSFTEAAPPAFATELYELFIAEVKQRVKNVQTGIFGAYMQVHLVNDGPVTLILEKKKT
jgi:D-aminoacyl-tRNA deacylase